MLMVTTFGTDGPFGRPRPRFKVSLMGATLLQKCGVVKGQKHQRHRNNLIRG